MRLTSENKLCYVNKMTHLPSKFLRLIDLLSKKLKPFVTNRRYRWGIILLLVIAPFAKHFYLLLPEEGLGEYIVNNGIIQIPNLLEAPENDWFYINFRNYFWIMGELLTPIILIGGMFLLFPKKYYPSYLVVVPFGYYLILLIHRIFFVNSDTELRGGFTISLTLTYMLFGIILFIISDKIIIYKSNQRIATEARIKGVINMPGVKWSDKEKLIRNEIAIANKDKNEFLVRESA